MCCRCTSTRFANTHQSEGLKGVAATGRFTSAVLAPRARIRARGGAERIPLLGAGRGVLARDGWGIGHWYAIKEDYLFWHQARTAAIRKGGDLTSLETNEEWTWKRSWLPRILHGYLLGGYQLSRSPSPSDGWKWLTGGGVQRDWMVMDDNPCGASPAGIEDDRQDYLHTCCQETGWGGCA
jgi:hypothetical protein